MELIVEVVLIYVLGKVLINLLGSVGRKIDDIFDKREKRIEKKDN